MNTSVDNLLKERSVRRLLIEAVIGAAYTAGVFIAPLMLAAHALSVDILFGLAALPCTLIPFLLVIPVKRSRLRFFISCVLESALLVLLWRITGSWIFPLCFLPLVGRSMFVCVRYDSAVGGAHLIAAAVAFAACFIAAKMAGWDETLFPVFELTGILMLVATLLISNSRSIANVSRASQGSVMNRSLMRSNILLAAGFIVIIFIAANIDRLRQAVIAAWDGFVLLLMQIMVLIEKLFPEQETLSGGEQAAESDMFGMMREQESNVENPIFRVIINVVVITVLVAAAIFILYKLGKALRKGYLRIREILGEMMADGNYVEEEASLFDWDEIMADFAKTVNRASRVFKRPKPWKSLSYSERVRRAYQVFIRKAKKGDIASLTVHEALGDVKTKADAEEFAKAYDKVRYGGMEATEQEAENASKLLN